MKGSLLQKLKLPENVSKAILFTRCNGKALPMETVETVVGGDVSIYRLGMTFEVLKDGDYFWCTYTVENRKHVWNSMCRIKPNGTIVKGAVNCFSLPPVPIDQDYIDTLLEEFNLGDGYIWDTVEK